VTKEFDSGAGETRVLIVRNLGDHGQVTCEIFNGNDVVAASSSSDPFGVAACRYTEP
jgi:hypothetical protein